MEARPVPRQAVLVVNAHSRKGRDLFDEARTKLSAAGLELLACHAVRNPAKLNEIVQGAVASGAPMVIVGGGDGSLSATVDDIVGRDCVFALLPLGTANSFARTLGIPLDLDGAIATILHGRRRRIDLGIINGDYFANCAAIGLPPIIGGSIPPQLKRIFGRAGYLLWAIWCLIRIRPFRLIVDNGTERRTIWATEVRIANGSHHGGVQLIENAELDSGEMVVQAVVGRSALRLIWDWVAKYFNLPSKEATTEEFHGRRLVIDTNPRQYISIDGEVSARTPATVEVAEREIEVVVPAESSADRSTA